MITSRHELINELITRNKYKSYLELGIGDPRANYDFVECGSKTGVDPYFDFLDAPLIDEELMHEINEKISYKMTSDRFFECIPPEKKYDIIFIDACHLEEFVDRDIQNSLEHLSDNGVILVHDVLPTSEERASEERCEGSWNGTVYKSICKLKDLGIDYVSATIDWGITAIRKPANFVKRTNIEKSDIQYREFFDNYEYYLNMVPWEDFLERLTNPKEMPAVKTLLCCIVKMENLYLRDFVEFYKKMGVTNIVLYDNNDKNGEYPQQVIGDYISDGYVIYKDVRGKYRAQLESYDECYREYEKDYDWIMFFDADEFVELYDDPDIPSFLSREKFNDAQCVFLYWVQYGDSGLLHYDSRPVWERFTEHAVQENNYANTFKVIVRGKIHTVVNFSDANAFSYTMYESGNFKIVNAAGSEIVPSYPYQQWFYENAVLRHYQTLTIDEFLCRRFGRRSYADKASSFNKETVMGIFYSLCERTAEKDKIIDDFFSRFEMVEDNV